jgi:pantetheine-phosphate adenylyltransferase
MKVAVFAGSFDPFTEGHKDIALRAAKLFDKLIILVGVNIKKKSMFSVEERIEKIKNSIQDSNIEVDSWEGLTVDYLRENDIKYLVRGVRRGSDFEAEQNLAWANEKLFPEVETIFLTSKPEHLWISSSFARELHSFCV